MNNLRLFEPGFSDNFETAMRRFFAPVAGEIEGPELKMRIDGNVVQIDAKLKRENDTKGEGGKAQARYADGVLTLELPKKSSGQAKKLAVQ